MYEFNKEDFNNKTLFYNVIYGRHRRWKLLVIEEPYKKFFNILFRTGPSHYISLIKDLEYTL